MYPYKVISNSQRVQGDWLFKGTLQQCTGFLLNGVASKRFDSEKQYDWIMNREKIE